MLHKTLAAKATTTTERGEFTAIAAAYTVDRVNDRIIVGAFAKTIANWRASGKRIPLHWDHKSGPENIIGYIDPAAMEERPDQGLYVEGGLDLEGSEKAREAWRLMKAGTMGLSFGYLSPKTRKAAGGILELHELDLFEITVAPHPVNPDTRFLSLKSAEELREETQRVERETEAAHVSEVEAVTPVAVLEPEPEPAPEPAKPELTAEEMDAKARQVARAAEEERIPDVPPVEQPPEPDLRKELQEVKEQLAEVGKALTDLRKEKAEVVPQETRSRGTDPLRNRADDVALQHLSDGMSRQKPPKHKAAPPPEPSLPLKDLKQRCRDQMLAQLSGEETLS